ncbi:hypothetical protein WIW50_10350 [Flavobacteriaceae bacterium 3-367]
MKTPYLFFIISLLLLGACSKDDGPGQQNPDPDPQNQAPEQFGLIRVADNSMDVQPNPSFSWDISIDPDGDTVIYDLFLDTKQNPEVIVEENITGTEYKVPDSELLCRARNYHWKVVAKDGKGGETTSETFSFTVSTLNDAEQLLPSNPFTARLNHTAVVFDGMWLLGGFDAKGPSNQVWFSPDGNDWEFVNQNGTADFARRFFHTAIVFNDALWVLGGVSTGFLNDVWTSTDGITWTEVDQIQEYVARAEHTLTAFQNKLWIIGGGGNGGVKLADVWSSTDGAKWERMVESAPFGKRNFHQTVAFKNRLWVIGGNEEDDNFNQETKNDVWSSADGIEWELETDNANFPARFGHKALVFDQKIWIIGSGTDNDIWYSEDGVEWFEATPSESFPAKDGFTVLFFQGEIWILGGSNTNEIWEIDYSLGQGD